MCVWRYIEWGKIKLKISTKINIKALIRGTICSLLGSLTLLYLCLFGWKLIITLKKFRLLSQSIKYHYNKSSVADPRCLSRILDPDFYPSRIPHLWSRIRQQHQKGEGKNFFCPAKNHKIVNNFNFEHKKFIKSQNTKQCKICHLFYKLSKIWVWDPGSGKPYSGSRVQGHKGTTGSRIQGQKGKGSRIQGQKDTGSRIRIRNIG